MQFVDDHALEVGEEMRAVGARQQQRDLFGRGQQNVGRAAALALPARGGRVARARFDRDFHYEDGTLAGLLAALAAVRARRNEAAR